MSGRNVFHLQELHKKYGASYDFDPLCPPSFSMGSIPDL